MQNSIQHCQKRHKKHCLLFLAFYFDKYSSHLRFFWKQLKIKKSRKIYGIHLICLRRVRDSNSRYPCEYTNFPGLLIRPLWQLSVLLGCKCNKVLISLRIWFNPIQVIELAMLFSVSTSFWLFAEYRHYLYTIDYYLGEIYKEKSEKTNPHNLIPVNCGTKGK